MKSFTHNSQLLIIQKWHCKNGNNLSKGSPSSQTMQCEFHLLRSRYAKIIFKINALPVFFYFSNCCTHMPLSSHLFAAIGERSGRYCRHVVLARIPAAMQLLAGILSTGTVCPKQNDAALSPVCLKWQDTRQNTNRKTKQTKNPEYGMENRKPKWQFLCPDIYS